MKTRKHACAWAGVWYCHLFWRSSCSLSFASCSTSRTLVPYERDNFSQDSLSTHKGTGGTQGATSQLWTTGRVRYVAYTAIGIIHIISPYVLYRMIHQFGNLKFRRWGIGQNALKKTPFQMKMCYTKEPVLNSKFYFALLQMQKHYAPVQCWLQTGQRASYTLHEKIWGVQGPTVSYSYIKQISQWQLRSCNRNWDSFP